MSKRPSGGQRTAAARQQAFVERRTREGMARIAVWVPDGSQEYIRQVAAEAVEMWRRPKMYDQKKLARAIEMAADAAYEGDSTMDVRYSPDRGLYIVLAEHEDGGRVVWSTASQGPGDYAPDVAARIIQEEDERRNIAKVG